MSDDTTTDYLDSEEDKDSSADAFSILAIGMIIAATIGYYFS